MEFGIVAKRTNVPYIRGSKYCTDFANFFETRIFKKYLDEVF